MKARNVLIALSIKNNGNWENTYLDIQNKTIPSDEEIAKVENIECITILDEEYPEILKQGYKPPFVLFYKGNKELLNNDNIVAVLGSRTPKETTATFTEKFVAKQSGKNIISGMSKGISTKALKTALKSGNNAIAVLGSGIDYCYPKENQALYNQLVEKGLIISEYPFDTLPSNENFMTRNRIINGLAKIVCVMDLKKNSSNTYTIMLAINDNKEIYIRPNLEDDEDEGNSLIDQGANCLTLQTTL